MTKTILPPSTIGILGGGQLGKMTAQEAKRMGYKVIVLDPTPNCPAAQVADKQIVAAYDDLDAAKELAKESDVITYEFENINVDVVRAMEQEHPVYPGAHVLEVTQHRYYEKSFFEENAIPVTGFALIQTKNDIEDAESKVGYPAMLKTCRFGYDGKGQQPIYNSEEAKEAFQDLAKDGQDLIWEKMVEFTKEISVVCVRNVRGDIATYPIAENQHSESILRTSIVPADISSETTQIAQSIAKTIAEKLNVVGTFCVELFVLPDGSLVANEIAPRPHNSGHYTIEGCLVSQFAHQMRAICDLPLGSTQLRSPIVMENIIGDGKGNRLMGIEELLKNPNIVLHLYGKSEAKAKRKMGHFTVVAQSRDEALRMAEEGRGKLYWGEE